jgi:hypothetical protein
MSDKVPEMTPLQSSFLEAIENTMHSGRAEACEAIAKEYADKEKREFAIDFYRWANANTYHELYPDGWVCMTNKAAHYTTSELLDTFLADNK